MAKKYKLYFANLAAAILAIPAIFLILAGLHFTKNQTEHETELLPTNQIVQTPIHEHTDYLLLMPPPQNVTLSRAPLPDVDYRLPEKTDHYLAIGSDLAKLLQSKKLNIKLQNEQIPLWSQAILQLLNGDNSKTPQELILFADSADKNQYLRSIKVPLNTLTYIEVKRDGQNTITGKKHVVPTYTEQHFITADISRSFYAAATRAGLPKQYMDAMIYNYSFDIDFQRDIHKGDSFEILFETVSNEDGEVLEYGDILFMNFIANRARGSRSNEMYLFTDSTIQDGAKKYYNKSGISIEKALLKTPVDGARLSSGFGYRHHPILGYNKFHQGVDFAARTGTPIYAAGSGVIEYASRFGSFGKYIRIRHGGRYKTVYAHLSGFAKHIKKGVKVKQKQIIGYVGATGRATGSHLHYEIWRQGKALNPKKLKLPSNIRLTDEPLLAYKEKYRYIKRLAYNLRNSGSLARK